MTSIADGVADDDVYIRGGIQELPYAGLDAFDAVYRGPVVAQESAWRWDRAPSADDAGRMDGHVAETVTAMHIDKFFALVAIFTIVAAERRTLGGRERFTSWSGSCGYFVT